MMSLAAPVASAVPARVQRRARPHAVASARATSRTPRERGAENATHRAPPRDGRARAGQDPGGAHRERRVHAVHGVPPAVGPEQPAGRHQERRPSKYVRLILRRARRRDGETRWHERRFDRVFPTGVPRAMRASPANRAFYRAASHARLRRVTTPAHATTLARTALTGTRCPRSLFPFFRSTASKKPLPKTRPRFVVPARARRASVAQGRPREDARRDG